MTTISGHTSRATGTVLTANIYNSDHQNHVDNANALNNGKLEVPSTAIDNRLIKLDGTQGLTQETGITVSDDDDMSGIRNITLTGNINGVNVGRVSAQIVVTEFNVNVTTGDGKFYFHITSKLDGMNLVAVHARVVTAGTPGATEIQIHNETDSVDMLSTKLSIDGGETGSDTAASAAVINTSNDDVATNDLLRVDVDSVPSTPPKGLIVTLEFEQP